MPKKVYCIAQFLPKPGKDAELFSVRQALEPNTLREEGRSRYTVTRHISSPFADGDSYPSAFNETWRDNAAFEAHRQRRELQHFFETHYVAEADLVEKWNVCSYSDEPQDYDAPQFAAGE